MCAVFCIRIIYGQLFLPDRPLRHGKNDAAAADAADPDVLCADVSAVAGIVTLLYVPVFDKIIGAIWDWCSRLMNGELEEEALFILSAFPLAAIAAYVISYRISCKLWLKGVAHYE